LLPVGECDDGGGAMVWIVRFAQPDHPVARDSCPASFCTRRYTKNTKGKCVAIEVVVVGTCLRHVVQRVCRAEARRTSPRYCGPLHDTNNALQQEPGPRNRRLCAEGSFNRRG